MSYHHIDSAMALLWCSVVEAVTLVHDQPGQGGSGHHNSTFDGHPLSCEPVENHVRGACSRSSSDHRGVSGDPNVSWKKFVTKVRVEESESKDKEEFKDSRENLPPKDPIGPSSTWEQVPLPTSIIMSSQSSLSSHPIVQSGVSQDILGGVYHEGVMDHADLIEDANFYQDAASIIKTPMKLYMSSR